MVRGPEPVSATLPLAPGYRLRPIEDRDRGSYWRLFRLVFDTNSRLDDLRTRSLPGGFLVIEHEASGEIVASAAAADYVRAGHAETGSLQWVMTDPAHTGKGLGTAIVAAATKLLAEGGYRQVYLSTDGWRLPAISVYLKLGWKPRFFAQDMEERWREVFTGLRRESGHGDSAR
jgi:mycothiol synthase